MPRASAIVSALVTIVALGVYQWIARDSRHAPILGATPATASRSNQKQPARPVTLPVMTSPPGAAAVEQRSHGTRLGAILVSSFDGLGAGFEGPQGKAILRNPSDNSIAVGPNHIMQTVSARMAIFDKRGQVLYGPVPNNTVFKDFGGACEATNNGDTVAATVSTSRS